MSCMPNHLARTYDVEQISHTEVATRHTGLLLVGARMGVGQSTGFVVFHRKIFDSYLWQMHPNHLKVAIACVVFANWRDEQWWTGTTRMTIPRGSLVTSQQKLGEKLGLTRRQVHGALKRLQSAGFLKLVQARGQQFSLISVTNYSQYQDIPEGEGQDEVQARCRRGAGEVHK